MQTGWALDVKQFFSVLEDSAKTRHQNRMRGEQRSAVATCA
jgi:hypothetical protein